MNYVGPDICPYTHQDLPSTESFCSQLGVDFYFAMRLSCGGAGEMPALDANQATSRQKKWMGLIRPPADRSLYSSEAEQDPDEPVNSTTTNLTNHKRDRVDSAFLCRQFRLLRASVYRDDLPRKYSHPLKPMNFAVWDCAIFDEVNKTITVNSNCANPDHLQLINDVSEVYCSVRKMQELRLKLCGRNFLNNGVKCAEAYSAYRKAQECVDQNTDDAKRCYQVCQWNRNQSPRLTLQKTVGTIIGVSTIVIMAVFTLRLFRGMQQTCIIFATDNAPVIKQILHQAFVRDPESSDEEDELVKQPQGKASSASPLQCEAADTTDPLSPLETRGVHGWSRDGRLPPTPAKGTGRGWQPPTTLPPSTWPPRVPGTLLNLEEAHLAFLEASQTQSTTAPPTSNRQLRIHQNMQLRGWGRRPGSGSSLVDERMDTWRAAQSRDPSEVGSSMSGFALW